MKQRLGTPLVDKSKTVPFEFDGQKYCGHPGDTLASALMANQIQLMGRSFKYHRPRGLFADGVDEPNALVQIGEEGAQAPNRRASEIEISANLKARSQNHLGSLNFDLMRVNDFLSPLLSAGFYYKTFMWPKTYWKKLYEPIIRKSAGMGALSGQADDQNYDRGFLFCDILIIGSGLAGLSAAVMAGETGADIILVEGDYEFGGRLIKDQGEIDGISYREWRDLQMSIIEKMTNIRVMRRSFVTGAYDSGIYSVIEHHEPNGQGKPESTYWRLHCQKAVLASGATERPIAFSNNDRPGIMLASAMRSYLNRYGVTAGENIAIFTNNDTGWQLAQEMENHGILPIAVIDPRPDHGFSGDFPIFQGVVENAHGTKSLRAITIRHKGETRKIKCDALALSGGFNPNLQLTCHMGAKPVYDERIAAFIPPDDHVPNLYPIGAANGHFTDDKIIKNAHAQIKDLLKSLRLKASSKKYKANTEPYRIEPIWVVPSKGRAFLDFQNDVTLKDVNQAYDENFSNVEHMKRYTTLGMGTDQGRTANINAIAALAQLSHQDISKIGTTTFRPPYTPVAIGAYSGGARHQNFAAKRLLPSHEFAQESGAKFVEAGLWIRPSYFPKEGETVWREACDREVKFVRENVGICDVSSLGKIRISGENAPEFLDLIYTSKMSTLKIGRMRYGIMLREDGMVLDDGTCAHIDKNQYLITTTTAASHHVLNHLEFVAQCLMPNADVQILDMTDHFAQIAIAGPQSRALLKPFLRDDISADALPFMAHKRIEIGGIEAWVYRVSFSGELGFEIAIARRYGDELMRRLTKKAQKLGGGQYGLEALNVLRIEKGFITHAEIDGRVTAQDLGYGKLVSPDKDCIGKTMSARPELLKDERRQLVGIKPVGAVKRLLAGAVIVDPVDAPIRENLKGHVSSVCFSPTLGHMIGLALIENGHNRHGEHIRAVDLVRDFDTLCEVVDPCFYDLSGEKMHG